MTITLDIPAPLAARLAALPTEKADTIRAAALDAIEEQIQALEAPVSPKSRGVSLEALTERRRAYWNERGFDFDKDLSEARPLMEG